MPETEYEYDYEESVEIKPFYKDIDKIMLILKMSMLAYLAYKLIKKK